MSDLRMAAVEQGISRYHGGPTGGILMKLWQCAGRSYYCPLFFQRCPWGSWVHCDSWRWQYPQFSWVQAGERSGMSVSPHCGWAGKPRGCCHKVDKSWQLPAQVGCTGFIWLPCDYSTSAQNCHELHKCAIGFIRSRLRSVLWLFLAVRPLLQVPGGL